MNFLERIWKKGKAEKEVTKKIAKEVLKELMIEQLIHKATLIEEENEKLKAQIAILTPVKKETKQQTSYIG